MIAVEQQGDPLLVWSERKQRYYRRKFDHDEARAFYASGFSIRELARHYGVNQNAIRIACIPETRARGIEAARRSVTTTCESCGGPAMKLVGGKAKHNPDGRILCLRCRSDEKRERLLLNENGVLLAVRCALLDCANGERWQPPENFPRGIRHREIREGGIHQLCRACNTRMRKRYRDSRKVPCSHGCGQLVLHENGGKPPECRDCAMRRVHASRVREPEAVSPTRRTES